MFLLIVIEEPPLGVAFLTKLNSNERNIKIFNTSVYLNGCNIGYCILYKMNPLKPRPFSKSKEFREGKDIEGLRYLTWNAFDSPDSVGSGFRFMEREPVLILDDIIREFPHYRPAVEIGYVSKPIGDLLGLPTSSPYRVGKGIRLRTPNPKKRMFIIKNLILRGVTRIAININYVEFDTDNYLKQDAFYVR